MEPHTYFLEMSRKKWKFQSKSQDLTSAQTQWLFKKKENLNGEFAVKYDSGRHLKILDADWVLLGVSVPQNSSKYLPGNKGYKVANHYLWFRKFLYLKFRKVDSR